MFSCGNMNKVVALFALAATFVFSGCFRRVSDVALEDLELGPAVRLVVVNPVGSVKVVGDSLRDNSGSVLVTTEKQVETYSLFGLADPDAYLEKVATAPIMRDGVVFVEATIEARTFFERLFVRIIPRVKRSIVTPLALEMAVEMNVGDLELRNLVGDVRAQVNAGTVTAHSRLGIFGEQRFDVNIGDLNLILPESALLRYDFRVDIGAMEATGFDIGEHRRFLGVGAAGTMGAPGPQGHLSVNVNIGSLTLKSD